MPTHTRSLVKLLTIAIFASAACLSVQAADNTRYISIAGNNADPCTLAKPCRSLRRGIQAAPVNGEVRILDSGFYGSNAKINKSLTISGNGHTLYLGGPILVTDGVVTLRGLVLDGQDAIGIGISIEGDSTPVMHIERCVIHRFQAGGIAATATEAEVFLIDSIVRDNGGGGFTIFNAGASNVTIDNSRFENNAGHGINIQSGRATISRSIASGNLRGVNVSGASTSVSVSSTVAHGNVEAGFRATSGTVTIESSVAHGNSLGLRADAGAVARISNSTFTSNAVGVSVGNVVETRRNNTVRDNGTDVFGTLTPIGGV